MFLDNSMPSPDFVERLSDGTVRDGFPLKGFCDQFFFMKVGLELIEDVLQVHLHVTLLDSGGCECPDGGKVLTPYFRR